MPSASSSPAPALAYLKGLQRSPQGMLLVSLAATLGLSLPASAQIGNLNESIFFQEGRDQFEAEIQRLQSSPPAPVLTLNEGIQQWQPVVSEAGGFALWAPQGIFSDESETLTLAGLEVPFRLLASQTQSGRYAVAYADLPEALAEDPLDALAAAIGDRISVPLVTDRIRPEINYSPRELLFQSSDRTLVLRLFSHGDRLYVVGVEQTAGGEVSPASEAFLDSFQFLTE